MYQFNEKINDKDLSVVEKLYLARFCYKNGISYLTDAEYDYGMRLLKSKIPDHVLVLTSYDDDPIPYGILEKAGFSEEAIAHFGNTIKVSVSEDQEQDLREILDEKVSKSITPNFTWEEVYASFEKVAGYELCISPKIDGIMAKALYQKLEGKPRHKFRMSVTKSRAADSLPINITSNMSRLIPTTFYSDNFKEYSGGAELGDIIFTGEVFCSEEGVNYINDKYNIALVNGRTAGVSMIRTNDYADEDYSFMNFVVHGVPCCRTLSDGLDFAKKCGFVTVPYIKYTYESMDFEDFQNEIGELIRKVKAISEELGYPTDGMVVEINDRDAFAELISNGVYDGGNFAVKVGSWKPGIYVSELVGIETVQKSDRFSFIGIIKPLRTNSGITVSRINLYNPENIIKNNLTIGCKICFMYKNETTPLFVCNGDDEDEMRIKLDTMDLHAGFADATYYERDEYSLDNEDPDDFDEDLEDFEELSIGSNAIL